ncbi:hypothetical protein NA56DRAFT_654528 [Hyaloscypha hepaticicola]|uniref:Uncharacterized protein n=1 Tax=Hyaloscypha hepaticicola TaxID=2082293 RepID=A0A2J6QKE0_9HELO|nr:hypothetical protein NA56DRAFT_654528 [Hyaloscypha hepaticicola]
MLRLSRVTASALSGGVIAVWTLHYSQLQAYENSTAAVSDNEAQIKDIITIPGPPEYIALMQEFTTNPNRLDPPPLDTIPQRLNFAWKALKRRTNLLLGCPGSPNAEIVGSMLTSLRTETESRLSNSITTIGIAFSNSALESREEVNDALHYAGLNKLDKLQVPDRELNAAYGAYGFGLCTSYTDPYKCEEEESAFGLGDIVLHLDYTSKTLSANTELISTARSTFTRTKFVDWKLGRDEVTQWSEESQYWDAVKLRIRDFARVAVRPHTQLLLTGDCAKDEEFLEVLKDALWDLGLGDEVEVRRKQMDSVFVVARGVAEFQRRRQRGWLGCVLPKGCNETTLWEKARSQVQRVLEL